MSVKEQALLSVQQLPDDATWADVVDRMRMLASIDSGIQDIDAGRVVPHAEVKKRLAHLSGTAEQPGFASRWTGRFTTPDAATDTPRITHLLAKHMK